jgi:hypothetical protein
MATAQLDTLRDIRVTKERGYATSLTRSVIITGLTSTTGTAIANEILTATNMPASGSAVAIGTNLLFLDKIDAQVIEGEKTSATATLEYRRRELSYESGGTTPTLRGGTALKQVTTAKDRQGNPIVLEHTFPSDHPMYAGQTLTQGGEISVLVPMSTLYGEYVSTSSSAGSVTQAWAGYVNSDSWQGGAPRTWMCTDVRAELVDGTTSPAWWRFAFTFEYDDQTWDNDTTAVFVDPTYGKPVADFVDGQGIKKIQYYPARNFGNTF